MAFLLCHSYFTTTARANDYHIRALSNSRPTFPCFTMSSSSIRPRPRPEYIPHRISDPHYVCMFDTTLRDGKQSPGATMTAKEKLEIAKRLAKLGVDVIEAGFSVSSAIDLKVVKMIARKVGNASDLEGGHMSVICRLARCSAKDIEAAWEGVKMAKKWRIHTFIATSEIYMKYKLRKTKEEVVEIVRGMVAYARSLGCDDVEFSPEDAGSLFLLRPSPLVRRWCKISHFTLVVVGLK